MCTASDWYPVSDRGCGRESMRLSCYHAPSVCLCDPMLFQTLPDFGQWQLMKLAVASKEQLKMQKAIDSHLLTLWFLSHPESSASATSPSPSSRAAVSIPHKTMASPYSFPPQSSSSSHFDIVPSPQRPWRSTSHRTTCPLSQSLHPRTASLSPRRPCTHSAVFCCKCQVAGEGSLACVFLYYFNFIYYYEVI